MKDPLFSTEDNIKDVPNSPPASSAENVDDCLGEEKVNTKPKCKMITAE